MRQSTPLAALAAALLLAGCGEMKMKVWPFGGDTVAERPRTPANAVEYRCAAGKRFYLRTLDGGTAAWVILPEREVRLERIGSGSGRYGKGALVLQLDGERATLADGATTAYADCRTGVEEPAPTPAVK